MNNEIALRTNKGEYHPGESVFGAVYLRICRPTEGCGIKISFKGNENCLYNYECEGQKRSLSKKTAHVDFSDITLYSQDDCFQFGSYVFPFTFQVPNEIAGTTELSGGDEQTSWKVDVSYVITAWVKGSDAIKDSLPVVIYQCQTKDLKEKNVGTAKSSSFEVKRFGFGSKQINVTVKLVENYTSCGLNTQLRLIITNDSKVIVTGFDIKLMRYLKFSFQTKDGCDPQPLNSVMTHLESLVEVLPEAGPHLVKSLSASSESAMSQIVSGGLDHLQVPLIEKIPSRREPIDLPPSSTGKCFKIRYALDVSVMFGNGHTETLSLVIPGVLPRSNEKWASWREPDWVFGCETKLSGSFFSAAEHLLHTEAFSSLPGFQVL